MSQIPPDVHSLATHLRAAFGPGVSLKYWQDLSAGTSQGRDTWREAIDSAEAEGRATVNASDYRRAQPSR